MRRQVRRAVELAEFAAPGARDDAARFPRPHQHIFRSRPDRLDLGPDAERAQRLDGVRGQIEACAKLAQRRRLLADDRLDAAPLERQRRGKPTDTAADDSDAWRAWHEVVLPAARACGARCLRHPCRGSPPTELPSSMVRGANPRCALRTFPHHRDRHKCSGRERPSAIGFHSHFVTFESRSGGKCGKIGFIPSFCFKSMLSCRRRRWTVLSSPRGRSS